MPHIQYFSEDGLFINYRKPKFERIILAIIGFVFGISMAAFYSVMERNIVGAVFGIFVSFSSIYIIIDTLNRKLMFINSEFFLIKNSILPFNNKFKSKNILDLRVNKIRHQYGSTIYIEYSASPQEYKKLMEIPYEDEAIDLKENILSALKGNYKSKTLNEIKEFKQYKEYRMLWLISFIFAMPFIVFIVIALIFSN